jgi:hypothetical protein
MINTLNEVNIMLAGRTIASVEPGITFGWLLINFVPVPEDNGRRAFMTVWVGESGLTEADEHSWKAAMHYRQPDGCSMKYPFRSLTAVEE